MKKIIVIALLSLNMMCIASDTELDWFARLREAVFECNYNDFKKIMINEHVVFEGIDEKKLHTLMITASQCQGSVGILTCLTSHFKLNPNARDSNSQTPLHMVAAWGDDRAIDKLLCAKANINVQDNDGVTPLMKAVERCQYQAVIELLQWMRIDTTLKDKNGDTAAQKASACFSDLDKEIMNVVRSHMKKKQQEQEKEKKRFGSL